MHYAVVMFPTATSIQPGELARLAEERGFESLWFPEHSHIPVSRQTPWPGGPKLPDFYLSTYDPFVALTAAATTTSRIKLATGICLIVQRDPIITAKEVASLDVLSGGRFIFGIGGGWNAEEMADHGTPMNRRFSILRERVLAMKQLWTEDEAEFHGRFVNFDKAWAWPKPLQKPNPPIVMGGDAPTTFDRVLEFCDGWMPISRGGVLPPGLAEKTLALRRRWEAAGRDPDRLTVSVYGATIDPDYVAAAASTGIDRLIFNLPSAPAETVLPALDAAATFISD